MKNRSIKDIILEKTVFKQEMFEFFSHSKNYITSRVFGRGIKFITIPIFTRLLLPSEYGILAIFAATISILSKVMGIGAKTAVPRFYYDEDINFPSFLGNTLNFLIIVNIFLIGCVYLYKEQIGNFLNIDANLVFIASLISFFIVFYKIYLAYLQAGKESKKNAIFEVSHQISVHVIAIILMLLMTENTYLGKVYSQLFITLSYFIYIIYQLVSISNLSPNLRFIKKIIIFGLPVVFHRLSGYILSFLVMLIIV